MSNIPPPDFNHSGFGSSNGGSTLRSSMTGVDSSGDMSGLGSDPWSNYGLGSYGDSSASGQGSAIQQYAYDRQLALQTLQSGNLDPQSQQAWEYYLNVTLPQWFQQYGSAAESSAGISGGDLSNAMGVSVGAATSGNSQLGDLIWQDQTRAKWDGSNAVTYSVDQQSDSRQQDFFQSDVTLEIPYHGSAAKTLLVADDSVPNAKMLQVTVSMPDGSSRVVNVHNITSDSHVQILSSDPDNVQLDSSVTSDPLGAQVTKGDINSATLNAQVQGDSPSKRRDGKLGWDGDSFNIYSTEDGRDKYISARSSVAFHASSNSEFWTVAWDDSANQYVVRVYGNAQDAKDGDPKKAKETFHMDDMTNLKASIDIDPSHVFFTGVLSGDAAGAPSNDLNSSNTHAQKLSIGTNAASPSVDLPKDATPPDQVQGTTATWNSWQNVNAYAKDGYQDHEITAPGTVTLHGFSYGDTFEIKDYQAGPPQTWKIVLHKDGKVNPTTDETFNITGGSNTTVTLDAMDASSIVDSNGKPEADSTKLGSIIVGANGQAGGSNSSGMDTSSDTLPSDTSNINGQKTLSYSGQDVNLHVTYSNNENILQNIGDFNLTISKTDQVDVKKETVSGELVYLVTVTSKDGSKKTTYEVHHNTKHINLQTDPASDFNEMNIHLEGDAATDDKIQLQGKPASGGLAAISSYADMINNCSTLDITTGTKTFGWTDEQLKSDGDEEGKVEKAKDAVQAIGNFLKNGNQDALDQAFSELDTLTPGRRDDAYELVFDALKGILGGGALGAKRLKVVLGQMPSEIRTQWVNGLKADNNPGEGIRAKGSWVDDPNWTHENAILFIQSLDPQNNTNNP
jgi:hypothetical protein